VAVLNSESQYCLLDLWNTIL